MESGPTRRLLAVLEYDGTGFHGFQRQKRGRTVQEELEKALAEFTDGRARVVGGGRTDAGVHATGQTASFDCSSKLDLATLRRALNAKLPRDVAVKNLCQVPGDFSARYSARSRVYRYQVLNSETRSPMTERFVLWLPERLDDAAMREAAGRLVGKRDFRAFGKPPQGRNTIRELYRCEVTKEGTLLRFDFEANAFLQHMVRRMVGTLLEIGRGKLSPVGMDEILKGTSRSGDAARPQGLTLVQVNYDQGLVQGVFSATEI